MVNRSREASVGLVIFLAGLMLIVGILTVGKESRLFARKVEYWTSVSNVSGISEGSPVKLAGVQVGTVRSVEFSSQAAERDIRITFEVDRSFASRIREGTQAHLKSLSYVSQERYLELSPGDPDRPELPPGSRIDPGVSGLAELTEMGRGIADDVKDITSQLRELLIALNQGGGLLSEMIKNPEFGRDSAQEVQKSLEAMRRIAERIEQGKGLAGQLLANDDYSRQQLAALAESVERVRRLLEKVESGQGALGAMTAPGGKGEQLIDNLASVTADLKATTSSLRAGTGLAGRLLQDDAAGERILSNLEKTTQHLESITGKIDRGEGTVGALLNDPEVYQGLRDVVAGVKKSRMGKGVVHHYQKKGAEEREKEAPPPPEDNP